MSCSKKHIIYIYVYVPTFAQTKKYTDRLFRGFVFVMCDVCATKHVHYNSVVAGKKTCSPNPKTNGSYEGSLLKNPSHESGKTCYEKGKQMHCETKPKQYVQGFFQGQSNLKKKNKAQQNQLGKIMFHKKKVKAAHFACAMALFVIGHPAAALK